MTKAVEVCVKLEAHGAVGVITIDRPPVNALDSAVRAGLINALDRAEADPAIKAVVLTSAGKSFSAGADLSELQSAIAEPSYGETLGRIENCKKPVIAFVFGTALGGAVELIMACHYRLSTPSARFCMPEIHMAIVPGAGGTQRLPRLVGAKVALEFLTQGTPIGADQAVAYGLTDEIVKGDGLAEAVKFAEGLMASGAGPRPTSARNVDLTGFDELAAQLISKAARTFPGRSTPQDLVDLIKVAATTGIEDGLAVEKTRSDASLKSDAAQGLVHLFFAERRTSDVPGLAANIKGQAVGRAAVIGAGTMGSGIAMALSDAGVPTVLIESQPENLERGLKAIRANYEGSAKRGRISAEEAQKRIESIVGSIDMSQVADVDLVIEAVFEDMDVKKAVLAQIDPLLKPSAIIGSNTSSLSLTELASVTAHPERVIGLHFFSPANIMKLLEIVRGEKTSQETIVSALEIAKRLRKIGVVSGDRFGFIGNRMMLDGYWRETELMMLEGVRADRIDRVAEQFGFAMGPMRVNDLTGVDIGAKVRIELAKRETRAAPYCVISDELFRLGRVGQKGGKGVYRYEPGDRTAYYDPEIEPIISGLAARYGIESRDCTESEIEERLVLPLINIAAEILAEGIAYRASDIDVVWTSGFGFPRWRGGPMNYADRLGLGRVYERMAHYHSRLGDYWRPAPLLRELAEKGSSFAQWDQGR
jgi:3-hydroxyacyl-CoA dehydrogenase